ncbi:MAG: hypothetical protein ABI591_19255 [Kofleriaceae bacterium]
MASFQYYALQNESFAILRELMTRGFVVIPEKRRLQEPAIETFGTYVPEIETKLREFGHMFLQGAFTTDGVAFGRRESGSAEGTYYVDTMCGPLLTSTLSAIIEEPRPTLVPGDLAYSSFYVDRKTGQPYAATKALVDAYKTAFGVFKRHLVRMNRLWVGKLAKEQIERGELFIDR